MGDLLDRLRRRGYIDDDLETAFRAVDRRDGHEGPYRALVDLDVPLPAAEGEAPGPSPRAAALLLRAADVEDGSSVLVVGDGPGYLADLARELTDGTVDHVDDGADLGGTWDRIIWRPEAAETPDVADNLHELGVLVHLERGDDALDVVKTVKSSGGTARMEVSRARVVDDPYGETGRTEPASEDLGTLMTLEASLARVWTGNHLLRQERTWERSVEETWRSSPVGDASLEAWRLARRLFHLAFVHQMHGDAETAIDVYTGSLGVAPSAEAYTFRGWTRSSLGDLDAAIADCKQAIETDPSLGNPYNDIGCYLLERGDLDEAERWFEEAKDAERYEASHFPFLNLARLHLRRGDPEQALEAARESARIDPQDPTTRELIDRLREELEEDRE